MSKFNACLFCCALPPRIPIGNKPTFLITAVSVSISILHSNLLDACKSMTTGKFLKKSGATLAFSCNCCSIVIKSSLDKAKTGTEKLLLLNSSASEVLGVFFEFVDIHWLS